MSVVRISASKLMRGSKRISFSRAVGEWSSQLHMPTAAISWARRGVPSAGYSTRGAPPKPITFPSGSRYSAFRTPFSYVSRCAGSIPRRDCADEVVEVVNEDGVEGVASVLVADFDGYRPMRGELPHCLRVRLLPGGLGAEELRVPRPRRREVAHVDAGEQVGRHP
jgi:hypothetical protein